MTASIGISAFNGDGKDFDTLYREADEALYRAKLAGKNRYAHYGIEDMAGQACRPAEPALRDSSASIQLKALIDNMEGGIMLVEVSDELRAMYLSRSCVRLMNLSYDGLRQADNKILCFIHPKDAGLVEETLRSGAAADGRPNRYSELRRRMADTNGSICARCVSVRQQRQAVLLAIVTDVTNLKETELNYEEQKQQLETVLKVSDIVTFEVDIYNHVLHVTDATVKKYGIDTFSIENMPESLIENGAIHPDSVKECRRMYSEIYAGVKMGSAVLRTLKTNGQYTIDRFTYFSVYDGDGRPIKTIGITEGLGALRDMSLNVAGIARQFSHYSFNTVMTLRINLSNDSYEFLREDGPQDDQTADKTTYSGFLNKFLEQSVLPAYREAVREMFSVDGLRNHYERGQTYLNMDFEAPGPDDSRNFYAFTALMFVNNLDSGFNVIIRVQNNAPIKLLESRTGVRLRRMTKLMC